MAPNRQQIKEAVTHKLGGPFDYMQFDEDIRSLAYEREQLDRDFKKVRLMIPDMGKSVGKATYDFSTPDLNDKSIFSKDPI